MVSTLTTTAAATLAGASTTTLRTWCRTGHVAAVKLHGRWHVSTRSLLHTLVRPTRRPTDRLRKGAATPQRSGRAARIRVGHHMSVARRHAVLDALCARVNGTLLTAAAWLRDALGANAEFVRRFGSPFGEAVATAHRALFGAEPRRDGLSRVGVRLFDCFAYDSTVALEAGAASYKRTAELLAA